MKNTILTILCVISIGCIGLGGGRSVSVNTVIQKPLRLQSEPILLKPIVLTPAKQQQLKSVRSRPEIIMVPVTPTLIPLKPIQASGGNTTFTPSVTLPTIEVKPIELTPLPTIDEVVLPTIVVEEIELKEIELPRPYHIKVFYLLLYYGLAALIFWLGIRTWKKHKAKKTPAKKRRGRPRKKRS